MSDPFEAFGLTALGAAVALLWWWGFMGTAILVGIGAWALYVGRE
jgi:hypothetical protein